MHKQWVIVTGATSGIGLAIVEKLLEKDYYVIGVARDQAKANSIIERLNAKERLAYFTARLESQSETRAVAKAIKDFLSKDQGKLIALINNAGCVRDWFAVTPDGYEYQFAVNHLAGFLFAHYFIDMLNDGVIIFTSSKSHKCMRINWRDIMYQKRYRPLFAYKQSKLCNVMTAISLNERLKNRNIKCYAVDPGLVNTEIGSKDTGGIVKLFWNARKRWGDPPCVPAETYLYLLMNKPAGVYFKNSSSKKYNREADKRDQREKLFALSEKLCGIDYGEVI